jgi:hypothetical protein
MGVGVIVKRNKTAEGQVLLFNIHFTFDKILSRQKTVNLRTEPHFLQTSGRRQERS